MVVNAGNETSRLGLAGVRPNAWVGGMEGCDVMLNADYLQTFSLDYRENKVYRGAARFMASKHRQKIVADGLVESQFTNKMSGQVKPGLTMPSIVLLCLL